MKHFWAFLLSLYAPGLGQIYSGYEKRGLLFFILTILTPLVGFLNITYTFIGMCFLLISHVIFRIYTAIDASRLVKVSKHEWYSRWYVLIGFVILSNAIWIFYPLYEIIGTRSFSIVAPSMSPTLEPGDVVVTRTRNIEGDVMHYGDLVAYNRETQIWIGRIVGKPGDRVRLHRNFLVVNGHDLRHRESGVYIDKSFDNVPIQLTTYQETLPNGYDIQIANQNPVLDNEYSSTKEFTVPANRYFFVGDNRSNSYDSRYWGAVHKDSIIAKALYLLYSKKLNKIGKSLSVD